MSILRSNKTPLGIGPGSGVPAAPTGLQIPSGSDTQNNLDWNDNNPTGLLSYRIYRSVAGGAFSLLTTITGSPPVSGGANTGLTPVTLYAYYVTAVNAVGESPPSATVSRTTDAAAGGASYITSLATWQARVLTGSFAPSAAANQTLRAAILAKDPNQINVGNFDDQLVYGGGAEIPPKLFVTSSGHSSSTSDGLVSYDFSPDGSSRPRGYVCEHVTPVSQQNGGTPPYSSGSGSAIHTYASMVGLDGFVWKGGAFTFSNAGAPFYNKFDPTSGTWVVQTAQSPLSPNICVADPVTKKILLMDRWNGNFTYRFVRTVAGPQGAANTISAIQANPGSRQWPQGCAAYRPSSNTVLITGTDPSFGGSARLTVDWVNESITAAVGINLGALTSRNWSSLNYDPVKDLFYGLSFQGGVAINQVHVVDPNNAYATTANNFAGGSDTIPNDSPGDPGAAAPYNRVVLLQAYRALGVITQKNGPASVIRLPL